MKRILLVLASVFLSTAALAGPAEDSLTLLNVSIEASNDLAVAIEEWNEVPSQTVETMLRRTVLAPLEAASNAWFEAGLKHGSSDNNPYRRFMACHEAAEQLRLQTLQLIRFHNGLSKATFVTFEYVEPALAKLDECVVALNE